MFRHYRVILRQLVINTLPSYTSISNAAVGNKFMIEMFLIGFVQVLILQSLKSQYYKIIKILKLSCLQENGLKSFCCYNSHEVILCGGRIYNLYIDATVVLARYV